MWHPGHGFWGCWVGLEQACLWPAGHSTCQNHCDQKLTSQGAGCPSCWLYGALKSSLAAGLGCVLSGCKWTWSLASCPSLCSIPTGYAQELLLILQPFPFLSTPLKQAWFLSCQSFAKYKTLFTSLQSIICAVWARRDYSHLHLLCLTVPGRYTIHAWTAGKD